MPPSPSAAPWACTLHVARPQLPAVLGSWMDHFLQRIGCTTITIGSPSSFLQKIDQTEIPLRTSPPARNHIAHSPPSPPTGSHCSVEANQSTNQRYFRNRSLLKSSWKHCFGSMEKTFTSTLIGINHKTQDSRLSSKTKKPMESSAPAWAPSASKMGVKSSFLKTSNKFLQSPRARGLERV